MADFEEVLQEIGTFGPYQITIFLVVSLFETAAAWAMVLPVFTTHVPEWRCDGNSSSSPTLTEGQTVDYTVETGNATAGLNETGSCESFKQGLCDIVYTSPVTSIISEWGLTCTEEHKYASTWLKMLQMAGVFFGAFAAGQLADIYGRKKILFAVYSLMLVLGFASSFSNSWQLYTALRCLVGASIGGTMVVNFVLPIELVGKQWRTLCGCVGFWAVGIATLPLLAYLLPNWRHLSIACSTGGIFLIFTWKLIPESPRWLIRKGRTEEAYIILQRVAQWNKKSVPEYSKILEIANAGKSQVFTQKYSYWDLFRTPWMSRNTLIVMYAWFVCGCVYYGTTFGVEHLSGNLYLNLFLSGIVEIPALLFVLAVNNRIGRRLTLACLMSVAGLSLFAVLIINSTGQSSELSHLSVALAHIGKAGIAGSWAATQVSSAELFPTVVRNIGIGASSMCARIGGVVAPQIAHLATISLVVPYIIFGSLGLLCAFLTIFLPETLNQPLPDTVPPWSCCGSSTPEGEAVVQNGSVGQDVEGDKAAETELQLLGGINEDGEDCV